MKISLFYKYSAIITLLLFCTCTHSALGQKTLIFPLDTEGGNLRSFSTVNFDLPNKANFEQIQKASFLPITQEFQGHQTIWIRFITNNRLNKDTLIDLLFEQPTSFIEIFRKDSHRLISLGRKGTRYPEVQGVFLFMFTEFPISLKANQLDTFYIRSFDHGDHIHFSPFPNIYSSHTLPPKVFYQQFNRIESLRWFYFFMTGFSFLIVFWAFFKSAVNQWDKSNFYYGLMFLSNFLNMWFWTRTVNLPNYSMFSEISTLYPMGKWFNHITPIFMWLFYRSFLNLRIERPFVFRFMTVGIWFLSILTILHIALTVRLYSMNTMNMAFVIEKVFEATISVLHLILAFLFLPYLRHPIYRYAAFSNWSGVLILIGYLMIFRFGWTVYLPVWFRPIYLLTMPLAIDGILFMVALTLRDRQIATENMRLQHQNTVNELKALRSQMNPHFIFNCLNAIKSYTLNHDTEGADFYLTKFSKLMRQVLENSRSEKITLQNELDTLTLYLDMEKLRAGDKLNYELTIADDLETDFIEIPPMLIQPYIENAIWHGLMHKEEGGKIVVYCRQKDDKYLIITILDNGIGRERAAELKSKTATKHKSFGMKITSERMDITKQLYNIETKITINDLKNTEGVGVGTQVILEIPL